MPKKSLIEWGIIALTLTGCANMRGGGIAIDPAPSATAAAICAAIGAGLPTRSRTDTAQTQAEIGALYADFAAACVHHTHLIPE